MKIIIIKANDRFKKVGQEVIVTQKFGKELIKKGIAEKPTKKVVVIIEDEKIKSEGSVKLDKPTKKNKTK